MEGRLQGSCCNYFVILAPLKLDLFSEGWATISAAGGEEEAKDASTVF